MKEKSKKNKEKTIIIILREKIEVKMKWKSNIISRENRIKNNQEKILSKIRKENDN